MSAAGQSGLGGSTWALLTVGDHRAMDGVGVHITFGADGALHGSDGCNRFHGTYEQAGSALRVHLGAATLMACSEPVMYQAEAFAGALAATAAVTVGDDMLDLIDTRGRVIATFGLRSPRSLTDTGWSATGVNNGAGGIDTGGVLQAIEFLNEKQPGRKEILIFSDMKEDLAQGYIRNLPLDLVFHGGSGSSAEDIANAVKFGVVKMNVDTDTQYAYTRPVADHMFHNYSGVLKVDGEVGDKKTYDPRAWGKAAEAGMAARVVEACANLSSTGHTLG